MESERQRNTHTWGSINGPSIRGRVGLNECVRKNFLKISEGKTERRKDVKTERRSFFVSCRRTYVLNNCNRSHFYGSLCHQKCELMIFWGEIKSTLFTVHMQYAYS